MSNETMTDARAIEAVCAAMPDEVPLDASLGLSHIAARLRGEAAQCQTCNGHGLIGGPSYAQPDEGGVPCPDCSQAAQGEQQAVAYNAGGIDLTACQLHEALMMAGDPEFDVDFEDRGRVRIFYSETGHSGAGVYCECVDAEEEGCIKLDGTSPAIRDRPQPVAVVGDAVRAAIEVLREQEIMVKVLPVNETKREWFAAQAKKIGAALAGLHALSAAPAAISDALTEEQKAMRDAMLSGTGFMFGGKRLNPDHLRIVSAPVAGDAVAALPWEGRESLPEDVRIALDHVNAAANAARHSGDYKRANALVASRVTLAASARTAVAQDRAAQPSPVMTFSLGEAVALLQSFGGTNCSMSVQEWDATPREGDEDPARAGKHAWSTEYPEEGASWLGEHDTDTDAFDGWDATAPASQPAPVVPEGWRLVPVEETHKMIAAAIGAQLSGESQWRAMLAAAPQPAAQEVRNG